jgi:peptidoglycan/LPS O-acetylase OafA/YrhL
VGRARYAAYLYPLPLLYAWNRLQVLEGSALSMPAFMATVLVVASASYRFVEQPFLRRRDARASLVTAAA